MTKIYKTIDTFKYGYTRGEFLPIMVDGQLANKADYLRYKLRCIVVKRALV